MFVPVNTVAAYNAQNLSNEGFKLYNKIQKKYAKYKYTGDVRDLNSSVKVK